jgi:hypothetical protein
MHTLGQVTVISHQVFGSSSVPDVPGLDLQDRGSKPMGVAPRNCLVGQEARGVNAVLLV